uniref:Uncharacterized protein n=1 Tax=Timema shepardi TaxID=629360 RepID=A0A7R9FX13_TIMSH|nr:unnamed protein product [Timema shepardi]
MSIYFEEIGAWIQTRCDKGIITLHPCEASSPEHYRAPNADSQTSGVSTNGSLEVSTQEDSFLDPIVTRLYQH